MKFTPIDPPRVFGVGHDQAIRLKDCGRVYLDSDEQVTFVTEGGGEYDVVRKPWGFYATPSLNRRLPQFGFRAALIKSPDGRYYLFLIERDKEPEFKRYRKKENLSLVAWLDSDEALKAFESKAGHA